MANRAPSFQWYSGDWRKDPGVQSLDYFDRGVWFELLMIMDQSFERGVLALNGRAMTIEEIAAFLGLRPTCSANCSKLLAKAWQMPSKTSPQDALAIEVASKIEKCLENEPSKCCSKTLASLLAKGVAKVWQNSSKIYCKRMVDDEQRRNDKSRDKAKIREIRREAGRRGGLAKAKQKASMSSSSSSTSVHKEKNPPTPLSKKPARQPDPLVQQFEDRYQERYNAAYPRQKGDFVQLAGLRKRASGLAKDRWTVAVTNYFLSPQKKHTLAQLCVDFEVFQSHALDRYGKPVVRSNGDDPKSRFVF